MTNLIPDELKIQYFPCPNCDQVISSEVDACRFCGERIVPEVREQSVLKELGENRAARIRSHKNLFAIGVAFFVIGIFLFLSPIVQSYLRYRMINVNCLMPIFLIGGVVAAIKGFLGLREEKRRL